MLKKVINYFLIIVLTFQLLSLNVIADTSDPYGTGWGRNDYGQNDLPTNLSGDRIEKISIGYVFDSADPLSGTTFSLALRDDGEVEAWGFGEYGQTAIPGGLNNVVDIDAGSWHALALKEDGSVIAWGDNSFNQLDIPSGLADVIDISANYVASAAVTSNGDVVVWGNNSFGQLDVPAEAVDVVEVSVGRYHIMALKSNGEVICWGNDFYNQVTIPTGLGSVQAISAGDVHSVALMANGTVEAWGDGFVTDGIEGLSNVIQIDAGAYHTMALHANGNVSAVGFNGSGQCDIPTGISEVRVVAAGLDNSFALYGDLFQTPDLRCSITSGAILAEGTTLTYWDVYSSTTDITAKLISPIGIVEISSGYTLQPGVYTLNLSADDGFGGIVSKGVDFVVYDSVPSVPDAGSIISEANLDASTHFTLVDSSIDYPIGMESSISADMNFTGAYSWLSDSVLSDYIYVLDGTLPSAGQVTTDVEIYNSANILQGTMNATGSIERDNEDAYLMSTHVSGYTMSSVNGDLEDILVLLNESDFTVKCIVNSRGGLDVYFLEFTN